MKLSYELSHFTTLAQEIPFSSYTFSYTPSIRNRSFFLSVFKASQSVNYPLPLLHILERKCERNEETKFFDQSKRPNEASKRRRVPFINLVDTQKGYKRLWYYVLTVVQKDILNFSVEWLFSFFGKRNAFLCKAKEFSLPLRHRKFLYVCGIIIKLKLNGVFLQID
jgi:hypothetical protein